MYHCKQDASFLEKFDRCLICVAVSSGNSSAVLHGKLQAPVGTSYICSTGLSIAVGNMSLSLGNVLVAAFMNTTRQPPYFPRIGELYVCLLMPLLIMWLRKLSQLRVHTCDQFDTYLQRVILLEYARDSR